MAPLLGLRVSPAGRAPVLTFQVTGAVPPRRRERRPRIDSADLRGGQRLGRHAERGDDADRQVDGGRLGLRVLESVAATVNDLVPAAVGVPVIAAAVRVRGSARRGVSRW